MFDILVYLFEHYFHADTCPEPEQLALKLSAAGFEDEDISEALHWLDGLQTNDAGRQPLSAPRGNSTRCYSLEETAKLEPECLGFLAFLESAGVLNPLMRELILERAMALEDHSVALARFKIIVLMVLWNRQQAMDTLILEELLAGNDVRHLH